ncbi:hypothetical protein [Azospirillum argentinense]
MKNKRQLSGGLGKALELDYVGSDRVRSRRVVTLVQVDEYDTDDGTYRVSLRCREEGERRLKDFLSNRILEIADKDTGEIVSDIPKYLSGLLLEAGGVQPRYWPRPETDPIRTTSIDINFGNDGFAIGWVFGVHKAFRSALDILCNMEASTRSKVWTQGIPPNYSFEAGDIFYHPFPWGPETKWSIRIISIKDRILKVLICEWDNSRVVSQEEKSIAQTELVKILRDGLANATWLAKSEFSLQIMEAGE